MTGAGAPVEDGPLMKSLRIVLALAAVFAGITAAGAAGFGCGPEKKYCPKNADMVCVDNNGQGGNNGDATFVMDAGLGDATFIGQD